MQNWLRSLLLFSTAQRCNSVRSPYRPTLEGLEERSLLAGYLQTNLISDLPGMAHTTDPNLINPWGVTFLGNGPFWVADNNSGLATVYDGNGNPFPAGSPIVVTIPPPTATPTTTAAPTGIVANSTSDFVVKSGGNSGPATFIFATEDGTISAWNQTVNPTAAILEVDNPNTTTGSVYKGLAMGSNSSGNFLFATNFRLGTIDVFDKTFTKTTLSGHFIDPSLPAGFAPFGIQNIGGQLFVSYAKQDPAKQNHDDLGGPGNGFIDIFDTNGNLVKRLVSQGTLNSPWGMVIAPSGFGELSNDLLVGNFKGGQIDAYNPTTGTFLGQLKDSAGNTVVIPGLWSLVFGNGGTAGDPHTLFFSAGIQKEAHGLFGSFQVSTAGPDNFVAALYQQLLHRAPDADGQAHWQGLLNQGVSRAQVALAIEGSLEHRIDQVEDLYQTLLSRPADPVGMLLSVNFLGRGGSPDTVKAVILSSPEYFQKHGGTNAGFMTALFQDVLHRPVDPQTQVALTSFLDDGNSRIQAALDVLLSVEADQLRAQNAYQRFLGRAADANGLAHVVNALQQGTQEDVFQAFFLASDEFFNKVSTP
jgi:uncharacterized protein (TIGR03118 family)